MKVKSANAEESSQAFEKNVPPAWAGLGQNEHRGTAEGGRSRTNNRSQLCWWEAGWFKDWERVARGA
jgi:hypothetical protein